MFTLEGGNILNSSFNFNYKDIILINTVLEVLDRAIWQEKVKTKILERKIKLPYIR